MASAEETKLLQLEQVLQRFEGDDQIAATEESASDRYFDENSSDLTLVNERKKLAKIYAAIRGASETILTRPNAAKFIGSVSKSGFFDKSSRDKRRTSVEEIAEIMETAMETPDGMYTCDALMAAVFAFRDKTSISTPGAELFDLDLEKELHLSKDAEFQFRVACHVASGETEFHADKLVDRVSVSDIDDVFLAIGYTMQEDDLKFITDRCEAEGGIVKVDNLLSAFEAFREEQIQLPKLKILYASLVADGVLHHSIQSGRKSKVVGTSSLPHEALRSALNKVLGLHGNLQLTLEEVMPLVEEISSRYDGKITFRDFVRIFVN